MEPPSSINTDKGIQAGQLSDDPLSCVFSQDTLLIVVTPDEDTSFRREFVCAYSAQTGLSYLGTLGLMES